MQDIDLSCWKVAFNGSEHIHYKTLDNFIRFFSPWGFKEKPFIPATAWQKTVFVSGPNHEDKFGVIRLDKKRLNRKSSHCFT